MTIWIDDETKLRVNIHAPYKGYSRLETAEQRAAAKVVEIADDVAPQDAQDNPEHYIRNEQTAFPYTTWERRGDEQIAAITLIKSKQVREAAVSNIIVTTSSGKAFDGDERAQERITRAIVILPDDTYTTTWILADNTVANVTRVELREALQLAAAEQARLWVIPYTTPPTVEVIV